MTSTADHNPFANWTLPDQVPPWTEMFGDGVGLRDALQLAVGTLPPVELREDGWHSIEWSPGPSGTGFGTSASGFPTLVFDVTNHPAADGLLGLARAALAAYVAVVTHANPSAPKD